MTACWDANSFDHESVLSMQFTDNPPKQNEWYGYIAQFHYSELFPESGSSVYLEAAVRFQNADLTGRTVM